MPITAEGIEDVKILETLQKMGEMKGQGYHYGRPEPAADVRKRLEKIGLLVKDRTPPKSRQELQVPQVERKSA